MRVCCHPAVFSLPCPHHYAGVSLSLSFCLSVSLSLSFSVSPSPSLSFSLSVSVSVPEHVRRVYRAQRRTETGWQSDIALKVPSKSERMGVHQREAHLYFTMTPHPNVVVAEVRALCFLVCFPSSAT